MILIGAGTRWRVSREIFISFSLSLFGYYRVIRCYRRAWTCNWRKVGGKRGEGLDQVKIDPTCLSFDFNLLFFLLYSMSLVSKIYRVLTLFIFFFRLISTSLRRNTIYTLKYFERLLLIMVRRMLKHSMFFFLLLLCNIAGYPIH